MNNYYYMYNYSFKMSYMDERDEFLSNSQYKKDLLEAFSLQTYNHEKIMKEIETLYDKLKDNVQIQEILTNMKLKKYLPSFLMNNESCFILLFSFENVNYFHKCLGYLLEDKPIDEDYFRKFVLLLQK